MRLLTITKTNIERVRAAITQAEMSIIKKTLSLLVKSIPTTDTLVFASYPDFTDNAYAIFRHLEREGYGKRYKLVWLVSEPGKLAHVQGELQRSGSRAKAYNKKSLKGLWSAFRCRHVFCTHGFLEELPIRQHEDKVVNLWHGMPIKRIGLMDHKGSNYCSNTNLLVANGDLFRPIMAESFGLDETKVLVVGQPRCDLLFEPTDFFERNGIDRSAYRNVGIWLPTYRSSIFGDIRTDGKFEEGFISFLDESSLDELNERLKRLNDLLIVKLHPMDRAQWHEFRSYSNLLIIKPADFTFQLYPLLGSCDYLLTDFSSVWVDYEMLGKPIGFVMNDTEDYSRGFTFDNVLDILPGPNITNLEELTKFIEKPYVTSSKLEFNKFHDNKSCERLVDALGIKR